jgi:hypothetical protein
MSSSLAEQAKAFASDPTEFFGYSYTAMQCIEREALETLQLEALRFRFETLYRSVPMVKTLADKQHMDDIRRLEDVVPMLFEHTMYKSYPPSLLENNRFDQLTRWLNKLTAHDLSKLDTRGCESISEWIMLLDEQTPLMINHSSGTSGSMSFNPFSKEEYRLFGKTWPINHFQEVGDPPADPKNYVPNVHVVSPTYRSGANAFIRGTEMFAVSIAGSEDRVHTLYPGRLDSDVLYLAARIRAAKAKGTLSSLKVSPKLLARQKEFEAQQAAMPADMDRFFHRIVSELAGKRVFVLTTMEHGL